MRGLAERYADATARAWEQKMVLEAADEASAERRRNLLAARPHTFRPDALLVGFCVCGNRERVH